MARPKSDRIRVLVPGEVPVRRVRPRFAALEVFCLLLLCMVCRNVAAAATVKADGMAFFENRIRAVLVKHCHECHSATGKELKGGLRVDSREALLKGGATGLAVVPGDPANSLLLLAVHHEEPDLAMPPKKPKLLDVAIADLATRLVNGLIA